MVSGVAVLKVPKAVTAATTLRTPEGPAAGGFGADDMPSRYLAALMVREFLDFGKTIITRYGLDADEMMIVACIVAEGTREMVEQVYLSNEFGYEKQVLPTAERRVVSLKSIHTSLGMSRETVRRKLVRMVDMGLVHRMPEGYLFPAQEGENDRTADVRKALVKQAMRFQRYVKRIGMD